MVHVGHWMIIFEMMGMLMWFEVMELGGKVCGGCIIWCKCGFVFFCMEVK